ncbi:MAG: OmpH family outer membrane protein [Bacteroidota bacterium]
MKNISLILNIILLIAVSFLYFNEFTDNDDKEELSEATSITSDLPIAYINIDTLLQHYDYYGEVSKKLDDRRDKLQVEYTRRAEALQKQIGDYQRTYTNMTMAQAQAVEQDLGRKQQELLQYQETIRQEILKEEAAITQKLYDEVAQFLKTYGEENGLKFVMTYSPGSTLMYANEDLEITSAVIEGLNAEYSDKDTILLEDSTSAK